MNKNFLFVKVVGLLFLLINMSACVLFAAGAGAEAGYVASQEEKTMGEVIDDQLIVSSIKTRYLASLEVSGMNLNVDSDKGVVTLRGFAQSQHELDKALEIARAVSGVKFVISKISLQD